MTIYRVYESFHENDESGTYEYGYYSSLEKATARMMVVWKEKKYPEPKQEDKTAMSWFAYGCFDRHSISIDAIEIDKDINNCCVGYT